MTLRSNSLLNRCAAKLERLTAWAGPFSTTLQLLLLGLVILSLSRAGLVAWQSVSYTHLTLPTIYSV